MYELAAVLDPDAYLALARAVYAEMALAGITCVGEFHYLHHGPDGVPYDDPNIMGHALIQAARDAGLRIALLDTCYLTGGIGIRLVGPQLRFGDGDADRWAARAEELAAAYADAPDVVIGAAVHSVRAVPAEQMPVVAEFANRHAAPIHVHLAEQRAEVEACVEAYCATPAQLLSRPRGARPARHRGARHPPVRRGHRAARRLHRDTCACAPPPSGTSPTASGPAAASPTPAARSPSARTATR